MIRASVVVPFYNAAATLGACLSALGSQAIARDSYEVIAVDDGSSDDGPAIAEAAGVHLLRQQNAGAPAARNAGIAAARGQWVAFTDADCIPSRGWLRALLHAVDGAPEPDRVLGAAGTLYGHGSDTDAARFVDLSAGLDVAKHLAHPRYPFAPSGNVMYRRAALESVGGFDERFAAYDACDLHTRLTRQIGGDMLVVDAAVCLHKHREGWRAYWRQQENYGRGLAQFYLRYRAEIPWGMLHESRAWTRLAAAGIRAAMPADGDQALLRRGSFVKELAQRKGFARTYFSRAERERW